MNPRIKEKQELQNKMKKKVLTPLSRPASIGSSVLTDLWEKNKFLFCLSPCILRDNRIAMLAWGRITIVWRINLKKRTKYVKV